MKRILCVLVLMTCAACASSPQVKMNMAVEVLSQPAKATVTYRGRQLGPTPVNMNIGNYQDMMAIVAAVPNQNVVERRIRILSPTSAQLIYTFGTPPDLLKELKISRALVFEYGEKVTFDLNKADLKPDAPTVLNTQSQILNEYFPKTPAFVCGFTDSTGSDNYNLKLSLDRAQVVAAYLEAHGVPAARLTIRGFGKQYPEAANDTDEGRAANRRTEIVLPD